MSKIFTIYSKLHSILQRSNEPKFSAALKKFTEYKQVKVREVLDVIDGDTVKAKLYDDQVVWIRFLMVDAPELNPIDKKQLYAIEAKKFLQHQIRKGKRMTIARDMQLWDGYDRLLAYLYIDEKLIQEELLKAGLARTCYLESKHQEQVERFKELEQAAKKAKKGIWSIEGYVLPDKGFDPEIKEKKRKRRREKRESNNTQ